jgi:beta-lactamase class A
MKRNIALFIMVIAASLVAVQPTLAQAQNVKDVSQKIEKLTEGLVGRIGVAAQEIGSDKVIAINGDETFAMASTYKVAIATKVMDLVDKGELSLDQLVDVPQNMYVAGEVAIAERFPYSGVQFSVANLIYAMITESDNTATDVCLELVGGAAAVTENLRRLGIKDFRVDRPVRGILMDFYGVPAATPEAIFEAISKNPALVAAQVNPNPKFEADPRDHTTPNAYLKLLLAIDNGTAMSAESRKFLQGVMSRTRTGAGRLKGLLPKGTPVAHKTGTLGGVANDAGYITLPDGRRFAIAVFTNSSKTPSADRDRAIAEVSRTLYDFYYLTAQSK